MISSIAYAGAMLSHQSHSLKEGFHLHNCCALWEREMDCPRNLGALPPPALTIQLWSTSTNREQRTEQCEHWKQTKNPFCKVLSKLNTQLFFIFYTGGKNNEEKRRNHTWQIIVSQLSAIGRDWRNRYGLDQAIAVLGRVGKHSFQKLCTSTGCFIACWKGRGDESV